jgi:hypothetical protein
LLENPQKEQFHVPTLENDIVNFEYFQPLSGTTQTKTFTAKASSAKAPRANRSVLPIRDLVSGTWNAMR